MGLSKGCGSKDRIDIKKEELRLELLRAKPNKKKVRRLKESIERNKKISHVICRKRKEQWNKK